MAGMILSPFLLWNSFEHDFVEGDAAMALKRLSSKPSAGEPEKSEPGTTIWNAKVHKIYKLL